ncbi:MULTISPECIES: hybrid sensor histidine kinase/response regulator [Anaeromyxobacter]|uniref:hybrid sensor histidine kinase/response regulator n=1 Tax=Anaeromyxobacter TaxID=161492 RepID=UPI001F5AEA34|nr:MULTISPECIES: hybrid sensor histidine kinase/response regulator [unclassified Anaeromyxobacter]
MPPPRILNVNDRAAARYLVTRMLSAVAFEVDEAESGEDALAAVEATPFDAVVLDVRLPGIDGYEVCRRLKGSEATSSIPVLLTSAALVETGDRVHGLEAGADAYLVQPFEAAELVALLRALLRTHAAERRAHALAGELAEAVRVRDEFMAVASHELKTPLTSLQLRLEALGRELEGCDARLAGKLDAALRQTGRLVGLVDGLLDVSRIASGRMRLSREELDLARLSRELGARFAPDASRAGCVLSVAAPAPVVGRFDRLRLEQLLTNLLSNALKYGAGKPVHVDVTAAGGVARLEVRDEGIGIDPGDVDRVFGRFERAVSPRNYGGLGLGLFIARQIAEAHGGGIALYSRPGEGARFTVELPLEAEALLESGT